MTMKLCKYRYKRNRPSFCLFSIAHLGPKEQEPHRYYGSNRPVFSNPDGYAYDCVEEMAEVCPYRKHEPRPTPAPTQWYHCPFCKARHRTELSRLICKAKHEWAVALGYHEGTPMGTMKSAYSSEVLEYNQFQRVRAHVWPQIMFDIDRRDKHTCQDCGGDGMLEVHHIIPQAKGGSDHPMNLKLVCSTCHRKYTDELFGELGPLRAKKNMIEKTKALVSKAIEDF